MYYAGAFLTVYGCMQCGAEFTIAQKLERDLQRKAASKAAASSASENRDPGSRS